MDTIESIKALITVFGVGVLLTQVFRASGQAFFADIVKLSKWLIAIPILLQSLEHIRNNSSILKITEMVMHFFSYIWSGFCH